METPSIRERLYFLIWVARSFTTHEYLVTALDVLADVRRFVFAFRPDSYGLVLSTCTHNKYGLYY